MAFLSDELEKLYKELNDGNSSTLEISKKINLLINNKISEHSIRNTRDLVEEVVYINGIVNRSSFVAKGRLPHNAVIRLIINCLPEEMAMKYYDYNHNLKEKLEELEKEAL